MKIKKLQLIEGAREAEGLTVIIDVFRAFSTACYVFNNGASKIIPVGKLETAYELKKKNSEFILMGERGGKILPGFDYGNSPTLIQQVDFTGKSVIHTTSAGTQGIVNGRNASQIISGSFVNAGAIADYIINEDPDIVSLVSMGYAGVEPADEDIFCAHYIESLIKKKINRHNVSNNCQVEEIETERNDKKTSNNLRSIDIEGNIGFNKKEMISILRKGSGKRFFDPANSEWSPAEDFKLCLDFNIFTFVLQVERYDEELVCFKKLEL